MYNSDYDDVDGFFLHQMEKVTSFYSLEIFCSTPLLLMMIKTMTFSPCLFPGHHMLSVAILSFDIINNSRLLSNMWVIKLFRKQCPACSFFALCGAASGLEVGNRTCLKHHHLHSSLGLRRPQPPPTCLPLHRFMWPYRPRPILRARPCAGLLPSLPPSLLLPL